MQPGRDPDGTGQWLRRLATNGALIDSRVYRWRLGRDESDASPLARRVVMMHWLPQGCAGTRKARPCLPWAIFFHRYATKKYGLSWKRAKM